MPRPVWRREGGISMAWVILLLAGLCEIIWAVGLKYTGGFTRLWPSVGIVAVMTASAGLLSLALKSHTRRHGLCGVDRHRRRGRRGARSLSFRRAGGPLAAVVHRPHSGGRRRIKTGVVVVLPEARSVEDVGGGSAPRADVAIHPESWRSRVRRVLLMFESPQTPEREYGERKAHAFRIHAPASAR